MNITNGMIRFTNSDPRVAYGLGELTWTAPALCPVCGNTSDFSLQSMLYDGCIRESPTCNNCGADILGLPVDPQARALVEARRAGTLGVAKPLCPYCEDSGEVWEDEPYGDTTMLVRKGYCECRAGLSKMMELDKPREVIP